MSVRTLAKSVGIGNFATGTYNGDGGATQAIAGVGFQPIFVIIYVQVTLVDGPGLKTDQDGFFSRFYQNAVIFDYRWQTDYIISLDADGFTVGDGTPIATNIFNVNDRTYTYVCWG